MIRPSPKVLHWIMAASALVLAFCMAVTAADCQPCTQVDTALQPCNTTLSMDKWPGTLVYQPTKEQSVCACNTNYFNLVTSCTSCQTSSSAHYTVLALATYQQVCLSFGVQWQEIYIPPSVSTGTSTSGTSTPGPTGSDNGQSGGGESTGHGLSTGLVIGIVVSVIALVVALSVAGYVYTRRKRERAALAADDELYKYNENQRNSYMDAALPQYTGMIQPSLPPLPKITNLRVMNPDSDDDEPPRMPRRGAQPSFEVKRNSSPGWRRGSFDDD